MNQKPIVFFVGEPEFFERIITDEQKETYNLDSNEATQAVVFGINHPRLGRAKITTSLVVYKFDDGSFETLNTIYKPQNDLS